MEAVGERERGGEEMEGVTFSIAHVVYSSQWDVF